MRVFARQASRRAGLALGVAFLGATALGTQRPDPPRSTDASIDVRRIRQAGDRIRPLHRPIAPTRPGDWLDRHKEPGQSFARYLRSSPNRPTVQRTTLYLQPVGRFDALQRRLVDATAALLGPFYNVPVKTLDPIGLDTIPARARREHPTWGQEQILSTYVLDQMRSRRPADAAAVLALTTADLWPGEGWNFVFGQASLRDRVGVWSLHRLGDPATEYDLCLRRTLKTAVHETGHMFGIAHCTAFACGMNGSNHLEEADGQPLEFCPEDEMKVWWCCRADPSQRYDRLARVGAGLGLDAEAKFWRSSLAAVRDDPNHPGTGPARE